MVDISVVRNDDRYPVHRDDHGTRYRGVCGIPLSKCAAMVQVHLVTAVLKPTVDPLGNVLVQSTYRSGTRTCWKVLVELSIRPYNCTVSALSDTCTCSAQMYA
jgi:hypothetical protein